MTDPTRMGAAELAAAIRSGEMMPSEVVEAHITRIEAVNPQINAVITPLFEQARTQAAAADAHIAAHGTAGLPPLFGIPVTIKEALAVAGVRHTGGYWPLRENIAEEDAEVVRLLKQAGAIVLGKTNCPDLSMSVETENPLFGLTRNPHDLTRTVGGSSGGEAAIISAGGSPLGMGSDIAGSVRTPAAMNGIVSLKPTAERIPTGGHIPPDIETLRGWNTVGPMARRIADLHLALTIVSRTPVSPLDEVAIHERRVISPRPLWFLPPAAEVNMAWAQAVKALVAAGMVYDEGAKVPIVRTVLAGAAGIYTRGLNVLHAEIKGMPAEHISAGTMNNLNGASLFARAVRVVGITGSDAEIAKLRAQFISAMGPGGVICYPTWPDPAPQHGYSSGLRGSPGYVNWVNVLGFPAVAVPVGHSTEGLPLSVQIVAQPGEDEVALAVAAVIEQAFGGWRQALVATP